MTAYCYHVFGEGWYVKWYKSNPQGQVIFWSQEGPYRHEPTNASLTKKGATAITREHKL